MSLNTLQWNGNYSGLGDWLFLENPIVEIRQILIDPEPLAQDSRVILIPGEKEKTRARKISQIASKYNKKPGIFGLDAIHKNTPIFFKRADSSLHQKTAQKLLRQRQRLPKS